MAKLTFQQKLDALSYCFYQNGQWKPKAGDHYTTSRADLELYRVVSVENGIVRTCYTEGSLAISEWPEAGFLTEGFGPRRVYVPEWVLAATPAPQPNVGDDDLPTLHSETTPEGGVIRLSRWPEGYVLWFHGEIVWRSWIDEPQNVTVRLELDASEALASIAAFTPTPSTNLEGSLEQAACIIKDAFEDAGVEVGGTFARRLASEIMLLAVPPQPREEG